MINDSFNNVLFVFSRPGPTLPVDRGFADAPKVRPEDHGSGGDDRRHREERIQHPDSQQVFVGNLPPNISEFELRDFFKSMLSLLDSLAVSKIEFNASSGS